MTAGPCKILRQEGFGVIKLKVPEAFRADQGFLEKVRLGQAVGSHGTETFSPSLVPSLLMHQYILGGEQWGERDEVPAIKMSVHEKEIDRL